MSHTGSKRNIVGFVNIATAIVRLLILSFYHIPLPGITSSWITSRLPRCVPFWSPPFCSCGVLTRHWDALGWLVTNNTPSMWIKAGIQQEATEKMGFNIPKRAFEQHQIEALHSKLGVNWRRSQNWRHSCCLCKGGLQANRVTTRDDQFWCRFFRSQRPKFFHWFLAIWDSRTRSNGNNDAHGTTPPRE